MTGILFPLGCSDVTFKPHVKIIHVGYTIKIILKPEKWEYRLNSEIYLGIFPIKIGFFLTSPPDFAFLGLSEYNPSVTLDPVS